MSLIPLGATVAIAAAENLILPFFRQVSAIDDILPDITIEERHEDTLEITRHPVEQNAAIADHAFKNPVRCTMKCGWSNTSPQALGNPNYVKQVYQQLLALQASREPFDILTLKRLYSNMLMRSIRTTSDRWNSTSMVIHADFEEVIIVTTQTVQVPAANQKNPQLTGSPTQTGQQSLQPPANFNAAAAGIAVAA